MIRAALAVLTCSLLVPAVAGTSPAKSPVSLTAWPARVTLSGPGRASVRLSNGGTRPVVVDAARAGFALDLRGRPRIATRHGPRDATSWITVRPHRLVLRAGTSATLTVTARLPRRAEPGDHDALVLLTSRSQRRAGVTVRMRIGIVVRVRAPGRVVRSLGLRQLRVGRLRHGRVLELVVVNRGNVTEVLSRGRLVTTVWQQGAPRARLRPAPRELRPRTTGIVQFPYGGRLRGWVTARASVAVGGRVVARSFRVRL
jgi:hypothetical protein